MTNSTSIGQIGAIGAAGLQKASEQIVKAANDISSPPSETSGPSADAILDLKQGEQAYKANAQVVKTSRNLSQYVLDLFA